MPDAVLAEAQAHRGGDLTRQHVLAARLSNGTVETTGRRRSKEVKKR